MLELFPRRLSLLAAVAAVTFLGACTTKHETQITTAPKAPASADADKAKDQGQGQPGEQVSADAAAEAGLSTDEYKVGRLFVNGWNGLADETATPVKWQFADLAAPVAAAAATPAKTDAAAVPATATPAATATTAPSATTTTSDPSTPAATATTTESNEVVFHIKSGTGQGAWNTQADEVVAKVGKKLTIVNDDNIVHRWHTNGAPCQHGNDIQPGESETCTPQAYSDGPLYDHYSEGKFYIRAE